MTLSFNPDALTLPQGHFIGAAYLRVTMQLPFKRHPTGAG